MTDSVEQCDRDAAQSFADDNTLCGCDKCIPVYAAAFARHRIAERERCAAICEAMERDQNERAYDKRQAGRIETQECAKATAARQLAQAIREPKP